MEKRLYFVDVDIVPEDVDYRKLTDEEFMSMSYTNYSIDEFVNDFNRSDAPSDVCNYCRYI